MSNRSAMERSMLKRLRDLREDLKDLIDYLDLLEARARTFGKKRYSTEQVKKMLNLE